MSIRLKLLVIAGMLVSILAIVNLLGKKKMDFKFGLGWILVAACIIVFSVFPNLLQMLADLVGIASPVNMLFFFGFILSVMIIFSLSMTVSMLSDKVKKLTQELAIVRKDMYDQYQDKGRPSEPEK